jgi:hypothetical protein
MEAGDLRRIMRVVCAMLGLVITWDACLSQDIDMDMVGGQCYTCGQDKCDWHAVNCDAQTGRTCTQSDSCCRGPGTGTGDCIKTAGVRQCVSAGCYSRPDEMCME